jgi:hypothetical protein
MTLIPVWRVLRWPLGVGAFVLYGLWLWWLVTPDERDAPQRAMCDKQVHVLLTTHDLVDLRRARYLIRELNCSVWRRIPAE